jgi:AhpD family alkylhydroperoxidase
MTYQHPSDLHLAPKVRGLAQPEFDAFMAFDQAALRGDGAIPKKYRELIALAVATSTKCAYCIEMHTRGATEAGADAQEIAEAAFVAAAVNAGGVLAHSLLAQRIRSELDEAKKTGEE